MTCRRGDHPPEPEQGHRDERGSRPTATRTSSGTRPDQCQGDDGAEPGDGEASTSTFGDDQAPVSVARSRRRPTPPRRRHPPGRTARPQPSPAASAVAVRAVIVAGRDSRTTLTRTSRASATPVCGRAPGRTHRGRPDACEGDRWRRPVDDGQHGGAERVELHGQARAPRRVRPRKPRGPAPPGPASPRRAGAAPVGPHGRSGCRAGGPQGHDPAHGEGTCGGQGGEDDHARTGRRRSGRPSREPAVAPRARARPPGRRLRRCRTTPQSSRPRARWRRVGSTRTRPGATRCARPKSTAPASDSAATPGGGVGQGHDPSPADRRGRQRQQREAGDPPVPAGAATRGATATSRPVTAAYGAAVEGVEVGQVRSGGRRTRPAAAGRRHTRARASALLGRLRLESWRAASDGSGGQAAHHDHLAVPADEEPGDGQRDRGGDQDQQHADGEQRLLGGPACGAADAGRAVGRATPVRRRGRRRSAQAGAGGVGGPRAVPWRRRPRAAGPGCARRR